MMSVSAANTAPKFGAWKIGSYNASVLPLQLGRTGRPPLLCKPQHQGEGFLEATLIHIPPDVFPIVPVAVVVATLATFNAQHIFQLLCSQL